MPIEMPRGLPFSVDTWSSASSLKRHHFLTHAHHDHLAGIAAHAVPPIYATSLTKALTRFYFPQLEDSLFVEIQVGVSLIINDSDGDFTVTAYDANHCPGAVMFLFEGEFGNILHTGDCRITPDCVQSLPIKYISKSKKGFISKIDYLFLDCTFGRCPLKFPSKEEAIQQVINCIWKHPLAPKIYLSCDLLGHEEILVDVSRAFGSKIYVDRTTDSKCWEVLSLTAPELLSKDPTCRFQVVGLSWFYNQASKILSEERANFQPESLFIRPSTQWYATNERLNRTPKKKLNLEDAEEDEDGIWHVCFSIHSSREEMEFSLELLQPKWVISTTLPCRAMELNYVKKHCFKTRVSSDDPIWKLFGLQTEKFATFLASGDTNVSEFIGSSNSLLVEVPLECEMPEATDLLATPLELKLNLSQPFIDKPVTLFGRSRLVISGQNILQEKIIEARSSETVAENVEEDEEVEILDYPSKNIRSIGSSMGYHASLRTLYRSKNVPIPQPLPSLVENVKRQYPPPPSSSELFGLVAIVDQQVFLLEEASEVRVEPARTESNAKFLKAHDQIKNVRSNGSSAGYHSSLRGLYRSKNVPVPHPLPSLVDLMNGSKRVKMFSRA